MEAIVLAGGKAERLATVTEGRPKALVPVAGKPIAAYQVGLLARSGVDRVIVSCAVGQEPLFERELSGLGPEIVCAPEPEPLGRGGGIRFAARLRRQPGPVVALNGDELLAIDIGAMLAHHDRLSAAATIAVTHMVSSLGVVELRSDWVTAFREKPELPLWVSPGIYMLEEEALGRLPERGDLENTTFPELAAEGRLAAYRYDGRWLTVNTPKDLREAEEHIRKNPAWLPAP